MKVRNLWKRQLLITFCIFVFCFGTGCEQKGESFQEVTLQETEQSLNETEKNKETEEIHDTPKTTSIYVYVCGAVNNTGVYELKKMPAYTKQLTVQADYVRMQRFLQSIRQSM